MFIDFMNSKFTADEKATELYKLLAMSGTYTETALLQEIRALIDENVDPGAMSADKIRKFLSFFYVPVRNFLPASGTVRVTVLSALAPVTFAPGSALVAEGGTIFRCTSGGVCSNGQFVDLAISQSEAQTMSGTYQDYISVDTSDVVLSSMTVVVAGKIVSEVKSPYNGYMAFYFSGKLYVKVFPGPSVPSVRGQAYSVSFYTSLGVNGNIGVNALSSFMFPITDTALNPVKYQLANAAITNGASAPKIGELRDLLRYWMFVRNVLTKPTDYKFWFLTQPEVGDCLAWGDTEEFLMGNPLSITGKVRICLLSATAEVLTVGEKAELDARVQSVKDIAYLEYIDPTFTKHYFDIRYLGASDEARFVSQASAAIETLYNLDSQRAINASLFDSVDVGRLVAAISSLSSVPTGLEVVPYYYIENALVQGAALYSTSFPNPTNLKPGYCSYTVEVRDVVTGALIGTPETFTELMTSATMASIIRSTGVSVGTHNYTTNTVSITPPGGSFLNGTMKVYGEAASRSYLDTGAFTKARLLGGYKFTKVTAQF